MALILIVFLDLEVLVSDYIKDVLRENRTDSWKRSGVVSVIIKSGKAVFIFLNIKFVVSVILKQVKKFLSFKL